MTENLILNLDYWGPTSVIPVQHLYLVLVAIVIIITVAIIIVEAYNIAADTMDTKDIKDTVDTAAAEVLAFDPIEVHLHFSSERASSLLL